MTASNLLPIFLVLTTGFAGSPKVFKRAPPPKFDRAATSLFAENAFDLLEGERPSKTEKKEEVKVVIEKEKPVGGGDFDRTEMMVKLDAAATSASEGLSDKKTFGAASHKVSEAADIMVMMGKTLFHNDPEYGTEDGFLKSAEDMTTAARQMKIMAQKGDYEGASGALVRVKKSCASCHDEFRL